MRARYPGEIMHIRLGITMGRCTIAIVCFLHLFARGAQHPPARYRHFNVIDTVIRIKFRLNKLVAVPVAIGFQDAYFGEPLCEEIIFASPSCPAECTRNAGLPLNFQTNGFTCANGSWQACPQYRSIMFVAIVQLNKFQCSGNFCFLKTILR